MVLRILDESSTVDFRKRKSGASARSPFTDGKDPVGAITKREYTLADGRDLIYFDDADTALAPDRAPDRRTGLVRPATPTMRMDPLTGDWVSIAAARQNRVVLPPADRDPLAPASETNPSEIPAPYDVAVFENRSPSFGPALTDPNAPRDDADLAKIGIERTRTAVGRCEVVCFSPASEGSFSSQSRSRARTVMEAWADRTAALSALPNVRQVFPFENRGEAIGVTLHHPHGQIYAYPYVTARTRRLMDAIDDYGPGLMQDVLDRELASSRVVLRGTHWSAFVPFAARWPIEIHLMPHRHVPDFAETTDEERDELAAVYLRLLRGVDALYETPTPYIAAWHQAPVAERRDEIRMMLRLTSPRRGPDRLKYLAGSESAMSAWIGDIPPEQTAADLQAAVARADREHPIDHDVPEEAR
jgi:UDPglucose--hexose-1-phosphate uridylyltransferase